MTEDLQGQIDTWLATGVITEEQAATMRANASADLVSEGDPETEVALQFVETSQRRDVSFVVEALAYVGGAIVVGTASAMLGLYWADLRPVARLGIPTVLFIALFVAGLGLVGPPPSFRRVGSVLWAASVVFFLVSCSLFAVIFEPGEDAGRFWAVGIGIATSAYALSLWAFRKLPLQQMALFGALLGFIGTLFVLPEVVLDTFWYCLAYWTFGIIWLLLAWAEIIKPRAIALFLGSATIVISILPFAINQNWKAPTWLAVSAAVLVAVGIVSRVILLFIIGAIGIAIAVVLFSVTYLGGSIGGLLALFLVGAVILGSVIVLANFRKINV